MSHPTAPVGYILDALASVIVGQGETLRILLAAILADGQVLIEDVPGRQDGDRARETSQILACSSSGRSFTPDPPADLTGSFIFDQRAMSFEFRRGPLFTRFLLADEINRAAPKRQSALG